ncbi:MAG: hypothetical protein LC800_16700 [Acidobacteria bacterium]|nr:hypothetical protein [Acidobacteriota bacterium]
MTGELFLGLLSLQRTSQNRYLIRQAEFEPGTSGSDLLQMTLRRYIDMSGPKGKGAAATLLRGGVVKLNPLTGTIEVDTLAEEETQAEKQAGAAFAEIASSRKRARKTQAEIDRLKKKTQAILDRLP